MRRTTTSIIRYQRVLALRAEGMTFQDIATSMGISRQRVWQIHQRAISRIAVSHARGKHSASQIQAA